MSIVTGDRDRTESPDVSGQALPGADCTEEVSGLKPVVELGRIKILRPDKFNYMVVGDGRKRYYATLPQAVKSAAMVAADAKARTSREWLVEFAKIAAQIQKSLQAIESKDKSNSLEQPTPRQLKRKQLSAKKQGVSSSTTHRRGRV